METDQQVIDELHKYARELVSFYKTQGIDFNKKMLRFNDIVDYGFHYARMAIKPTIEIAKHGVYEAVLMCIKNTAYSLDKPIQQIISEYKWMEG